MVLYLFSLFNTVFLSSACLCQREAAHRQHSESGPIFRQAGLCQTRHGDHSSGMLISLFWLIVKLS
jgi:hypothetical protein